MTNITEIRRRVATMANRLKKMGLTLTLPPRSKRYAGIIRRI